MNVNDMVLDIHQEVEIKAAPGDVFRSVTKQLGQILGGDGKPMKFVLEEWPGGRWFRDLGGSQGHLWGFVQVIKPPTLLEISGPLMMSNAVAGHVQLRCTPIAGGTLVVLRHRAVGLIDAGHREGVNKGWGMVLDGIKALAEQPVAAGV